jgi:hypothetical protein
VFFATIRKITNNIFDKILNTIEIEDEINSAVAVIILSDLFRVLISLTGIECGGLD